MKLSKFTYLVVFHFAILCCPSKIDGNPYYNNKGTESYIDNQASFMDTLCSGVLGPNLLKIGDFGADTANVVLNNPFVTLGYDYQSSPPPDDGSYTITNDISNWGSFAELFWINIGDRSLDSSGYMMVVNAHFEPGNFYKERVAVCENTTYTFSADMINLTKRNIPNFILPSVDFIINGVTVASMTDLPQDEEWYTTGFSYTTGPGETSISYVIRNSAPGGFGNDLAFDNIFMKTCKSRVAITKHGTLCDDGYLKVIPFHFPDNFTPHYQWQYSENDGSIWSAIDDADQVILQLNNLPSHAIYRCLLASGPNNFDMESCYSVSNKINISFPIIEKQTNPIICEDEVYAINGKEYTLTGEYVDTFTSFFGCDSIVITNLEVLKKTNFSNTVYICENETYDFIGNIISETNQYKDTLVNAAGCDSLITLDLIVLKNSSSLFEKSICEADSYFFNDELLSTTGIYLDTLTSYNGCDSFITLQFNVNLSYETFVEETICYGEQYTFGGIARTTSDEYTITLPTVNGCDSILNLSLEVLEKKEHLINKLVCGGNEFMYNNTNYSTTGVYFETLPTNSGCDSTITLDLVFELSVAASFGIDICEGESYFFKNLNLTESGIYKDSLLTQEGCDSIITLTLNKLERSMSNIQQDICEDEVFQFGDLELTNSGTYTKTLENQNGCDSIVNLTLSVHSKYESELPIHLCFGEVYEHDGINYATSGIYPITYNTNYNCDSTILLQLTIEAENIERLQQEICDGEIFEMGGSSYTTSGSYEIIEPLATGCNSLFLLNLVVHPNEETYLEETVCFGESYQIGNTNYTENGTHTTVLASENGCDSMVILSLFVAQPKSFETLSFCDGENYKGIQTDTTITEIEASYLGCDSVIQLQLRFHKMDALAIIGDPVYCEGEDFVLSVNNFDTYLWSNGATTSSIEGTAPGVYEVTVWNENGCSKTTSIEMIMRNLAAEITYQDLNCNNSNAGMIEIEDVFGNGGDYLYSIDGVEYTNNNIFFNLSAGQYAVSVKDELGCEYVEELVLKEPANYEFSIGEDVLLEYGDSTKIEIESESDSDIIVDTFYWFPTAGLSCLDCMTPVASPLNSTIYTLTIKTADGCTVQDQIRINVFKQKDVFTPNIFSPNNDGNNDLFTIYAGKMVERIVTFEIYDRWGEHIYSEAPNSFEMMGWDGTFKSRNLPQDVYIYVARISFIDGTEEVISGDVTLVR